ncbi:MAG TPA: LiaF-related protein, partial [Bacilli bacterium]|nr:LiaF-related protein [Bacilli bacterium]
GINLISLILTIGIVAILIKSIRYVSFTGILFSIAFILIIYSKQLGITDITPWPVLLAALFGSIGLSIIFGSRFHNHIEKCHKHEFTKEELNEGIIDVHVSFGASAKYINTKELETANISCSFGATEVYFDNAQIKGDTATVNLDVSFSGVEIYIPRDWRIENRVDVSLGDIEEKGKPNSETTKTLILTGHVSLSGVEVIYI